VSCVMSQSEQQISEERSSSNEDQLKKQAALAHVESFDRFMFSLAIKW